jgi:hypothetical protein
LLALISACIPFLVDAQVTGQATAATSHALRVSQINASRPQLQHSRPTESYDFLRPECPSEDLQMSVSDSTVFPPLPEEVLSFHPSPAFNSGGPRFNPGSKLADVYMYGVRPIIEHNDIPAPSSSKAQAKKEGAKAYEHRKRERSHSPVAPMPRREKCRKTQSADFMPTIASEPPFGVESYYAPIYDPNMTGDPEEPAPFSPDNVKGAAQRAYQRTFRYSPPRKMIRSRSRSPSNDNDH